MKVFSVSEKTLACYKRDVEPPRQGRGGLLKYLSSCLVVQGFTKTSLSPAPSLSSAYWILCLSPFSKLSSPFFQVSIPKRERVWAPLPYIVLESLGRRLCRMCLKYPPLCYCRSELSKNFTFGPILLCLPASLLSPLFKLFPRDPVCWFRIAYSVASKNPLFSPPPSYRSWCCLSWE